MQNDTLATRLKRLRQVATLTEEEALERLRQRYVDRTDEELIELLKAGLPSGLTQQELANRAGVHRTLISKIEGRARLNPGLETLQALAQALGVLVDELVPTPTVGANSNAYSTAKGLIRKRIEAKLKSIDDPEILKQVLQFVEFLKIKE